jgi:hypothetical protein
MQRTNYPPLPYNLYPQLDIYSQSGAPGRYWYDDPYYGISSGLTGKVKVVGPGYVPLPGDKAKIIPGS